MVKLMTFHIATACMLLSLSVLSRSHAKEASTATTHRHSFTKKATQGEKLLRRDSDERVFTGPSSGSGWTVDDKGSQNHVFGEENHGLDEFRNPSYLVNRLHRSVTKIHSGLTKNIHLNHLKTRAIPLGASAYVGSNLWDVMGVVKNYMQTHMLRGASLDRFLKEHEYEFGASLSEIALVSLGQKGVPRCKCIRDRMVPLPNPASLKLSETVLDHAKLDIACSKESAKNCKTSDKCKFLETPKKISHPYCEAKARLEYSIDTSKCGWASPLFEEERACHMLKPPLCEDQISDQDAGCIELNETAEETCQPKSVCIPRGGRKDNTSDPTTANTTSNYTYPDSYASCVTRGVESAERCLLGSLPDGCGYILDMKCKLKKAENECKDSAECYLIDEKDCNDNTITHKCRPKLELMRDHLIGPEGQYLKELLHCRDQKVCRKRQERALAGVLFEIIATILFAAFYKARVVDKLPELPRDLYSEERGPYHSNGKLKRDFQYGLFACILDQPIACHTGFCPVVRHAQNMAAAGVMGFWPTFCLLYLTYSLCCPLGWAIAVVQTMQFRKKLGLKEDNGAMFEDAMAIGFCATCMVGRMAMELDNTLGVRVQCCCSVAEIPKGELLGDTAATGTTALEVPGSEANDAMTFLSKYVEALWPRIKVWFIQYVKTEIEPEIKKQLPSALRGFVNFSEVQIGDQPPVFSRIQVDQKDNGAIEMSLGIRWEADLHLTITAAGIDLGVEKLVFDGTACQRYWPPKDEPPFVGGTQTFFVNMPTLEIYFNGAADLPGVRNIARKVVQKAFAAALVLPNRAASDWDEKDDLDTADLRCPDPYAVLRFTLLKGEGLLPGDVSIFRSKTDPYVVATLGENRWVSSTIKGVSGDIPATWGEGGLGEITYFPLHDERQQMKLQLFDADWLKDDLMSELPSITIQDLTKDKQVELQLARHREPTRSAGKLTVATHFMKLVYINSMANNSLYVAVKILDAFDLPQITNGPIKVRITVGGEQKTSKAGISAERRDEVLRVLPAGLALKAKGASPAEIAATLKIPIHTVDQFLTAQANSTADVDVNGFLQDVYTYSRLERPVFDQVIQFVLVAPVSADTEVVIELIDGDDAVKGTFTVKLTEAIKNETGYPGPFKMKDPGAAAEGASVEKGTLQGSIRVLSLVA